MDVRFIKQASGIAVIEMLPLLVVFVSLIGITTGLWGAIHSGTLQSIAARHYAFEVINNRTHIDYVRDIPTSSGGHTKMLGNTRHEDQSHFYDSYLGSRFFGIVSYQTSTTPDPFVASRGISFFKDMTRKDGDIIQNGVFGPLRNTDKTPYHNDLFDREVRNLPQKGVNPIWLMQGYGICLNASCGD